LQNKPDIKKSVLSVNNSEKKPIRCHFLCSLSLLIWLARPKNLGIATWIMFVPVIERKLWQKNFRGGPHSCRPSWNPIWRSCDVIADGTIWFAGPKNLDIATWIMFVSVGTRSTSYESHRPYLSVSLSVILNSTFVLYIHQSYYRYRPVYSLCTCYNKSS
jgi:hypothetical protein